MNSTANRLIEKIQILNAEQIIEVEDFAEFIPSVGERTDKHVLRQ